MKEGTELKLGDVVQLGPDCGNPMFAYCLMTITEPKPFGAMGYVQALGANGQPGGQAFYRARWADMEYVGRAAWLSSHESEAEALRAAGFELPPEARTP